MVLATAHIAGAGSANAARSNLYGTGLYGAGIYPGTRIYEDTVLTPAPTVVLASLASTAVSNAFTPPPNSLVVVAVDIAFAATVPGAPAVSVADSAGNSYLPNTQIYDGTTNGSYFFSFAYGASTQAVTLTVTRSVNNQAMISIAPRIIIGAAANQGGSGTAVVPAGSSAVTVVQNTTLQITASLTSATVTLPGPTASGNSLVATILTNGNTTNPVVAGLTLGGSPDHWNPVAKADPTQSYGGEIWYDPNCASGQTVVTVNCTGGAGGGAEIWLAVYEVTGAVAADQASANADGSGTATTWTSGTTSTTSRNNEIFFGIMRGRVPVAVSGGWTTQNLNEAYTGYLTVSTPQTATFTGSQTAFIYVAAVATFAGAATGGSSSTAINGQITTNRAGSLVYVTGTVGATESATSFTPVGGTSQIAAASSATDAKSEALGRLPGVGGSAGTFPVGWTVPTAAPFSLAALEIFGPLADVNTAVAGSGNATGTLIVGSLHSVTANIGGAGTAGAPPVIRVSAAIAGAGVASSPTSGTIQFAFGTAQGAGEADQVVPTIGALAPAQGAGAAVAVVTVGTTGTAQGAGAAATVPTVGAFGTAQGAGAVVIAPAAAGLALGAGAAVAVATLFTTPGTAQGAGGAIILSPVVAASATVAGAGVAGTLPVLRVLSGLHGTGVATTTGTGLPVQPLAAISGTGRAGALPTLSVAAAMRGAALLTASAPVGSLNTDDTIEPGPCTLAMAVGPTTSRAPVAVGATGPDGSTVGSSTSAMAVGNLVSDRGN